MSRITIAVDSTIGSGIGMPGEATEPTPQRPCPPGASGWPVGRGRVPDTLDEDGQVVEALVLMGEPALPGVEVRARPVAMLHLAGQDHPVEEVVCVAEAPYFADLADVPDLARWNAEPEAWVAALDHLSPGADHTVTGWGRREEAECCLAETQHLFLQLTGCLE
jgi:inorganic pyrophosphatase